MLLHPTLDKLNGLKLTGMITALTEQTHLPDIEQLSFEERLGLL
ncbi:MAG: AAA family ATPase, partial [Gammaproteobacteria bacterium]|nr:AAA family ATPase [Gammaproteobacteria bacterium]